MPKEADYYGTIVTALNGDIGKSGPLFRLEGALYDFNYQETQPAWSTRIEGKESRGTASLGYQFVANDVFYNVYVGVDTQSIGLSPSDPYNNVRGERTGAEVSGIIVSGPTQPVFFEFVPSYSTAFDRYFVRLRVGPTIDEGALVSKITIGPEIVGFGDVAYDTRRLGAFIIFPVELGPLKSVAVSASSGYQWVSYASGVTGQGAPGVYGTVGFAVTF